MSSARDDSPSSTLRESAAALGAPAVGSGSPPAAPAPATGRPASTVASSSEDEKTKTFGDVDEKDATHKAAMGKQRKGDYEERGIVEVEEDGKVRKAMVVVEEKSGKELLRDVAGGPYTTPQW